MKTQNIYKIFLRFIILPGIFLTSGCGNNSNQDIPDTPTSGKIFITADETLAPIIESEISTFEQIYTFAKIYPRFKPEADLFNDLLSDSSKIVVSARKLSDDEEKYFEKIKIVPRATKICYDAVAVIVHKQNRDTLITLQNFAKIARGEIQSWKGINSKSMLSQIQIVFDHRNSGTVRYIKSLFSIDSLPDNWYALQSNTSVIDFVSKNKNAIGLIGVNWISDKDDSVSRGFLKNINVIGLTAGIGNTAEDEFYQPYQAYIAQNLYPLRREIYIISREARAGLGSGFTAFVASEKGQRIFLKAGLVPATAPLRIVELKNENILDN